jgi:hypothetical protein
LLGRRAAEVGVTGPGHPYGAPCGGISSLSPRRRRGGTSVLSREHNVAAVRLEVAMGRRGVPRSGLRLMAQVRIRPVTVPA